MTDTVVALRSRLARLEHEAAARQRQLEHYAATCANAQAEFGFLLHDIGKVAVPDAILFKPGPLSDEERALVRKHPETGSEILRHVDFLDEAKVVVRHHHERWDGGGQPDGLAGAAIPAAARVFAIADALDALTSERAYRAAVRFPEARRVIRAASGSHFDPEIVAAYESVPDDAFVRIRDGLA